MCCVCSALFGDRQKAEVAVGCRRLCWVTAPQQVAVEVEVEVAHSSARGLACPSACLLRLSGWISFAFVRLLPEFLETFPRYSEARAPSRCRGNPLKLYLLSSCIIGIVGGWMLDQTVFDRLGYSRDALPANAGKRDIPSGVSSSLNFLDGMGRSAGKIYYSIISLIERID